MRELRFVTPGEDAGHIVVETQPGEGEDSERFVLTVTEELRAAVTPARRPSPAPLAAPVTPPAPATPSASGAPAAEAPAPAPAPAKAKGEPAISPREIQVRVRSGETPEEIAEVFEADLDWVLRFAGPVLEERGRVTDEARRARARRGTADAQTVIFGETVDGRFSAHGIDPALVTWDSHRREDGQWVVSAHWVGGDSERTAEWTFSLSSRTVTPVDETATDLLSDRPIRPVFTEAPVTLATAPPLAPGVVAFPAMPNAHTGPLPSREQLFDQQRFDEGPRAVPPVTPIAPVTPLPAPAAASTPSTALPPPERPSFDAPPLPLGLIEPELDFVDEDLDDALADEPDQPASYEPPAPPEQPEPRIPQVTNLGIAHREPARRAETEEDKAARAHIPSWDDILLGVRRKND